MRAPPSDVGTNHEVTSAHALERAAWLGRTGRVVVEAVDAAENRRARAGRAVRPEVRTAILGAWAAPDATTRAPAGAG